MITLPGHTISITRHNVCKKWSLIFGTITPSVLKLPVLSERALTLGLQLSSEPVFHYQLFGNFPYRKIIFQSTGNRSGVIFQFSGNIIIWWFISFSAAFKNTNSVLWKEGSFSLRRLNVCQNLSLHLRNRLRKIRSTRHFLYAINVMNENTKSLAFFMAATRFWIQPAQPNHWNYGTINQHQRNRSASYRQRATGSHDFSTVMNAYELNEETIWSRRTR